MWPHEVVLIPLCLRFSPRSASCGVLGLASGKACSVPLDSCASALSAVVKVVGRLLAARLARAR